MIKKSLCIISIFDLLLIALASFSFSSCDKCSNYFSSEMNTFQEVCSIIIYYMEPCWCLELDAPPESSHYLNLITEEDIRDSFDFMVEIPGGTKKANSFLQELYSSKRIKTFDNKVKLRKFGGIEYFWQDGIIIDISYKDINKEKDVYIMQNGKKVFYKKGEEDKYYKMPWKIQIRNFWEE